MNIEVERGTIHAVVGERRRLIPLMKVLAGAVRPDTGEILIEGQPATLDTPAAARVRVSASSARSSACFPGARARNLFVNRELGAQWADRCRRMEDDGARAARARPRYRPAPPLSRLSIGERQLVEALPRAAGGAAAGHP